MAFFFIAISMYTCYDICSKGVKQMERIEKVRYTSYLPREMVDELKELSDKTRVPQAKLIEEAVQDLLEKYNGKLSIYRK